MAVLDRKNAVYIKITAFILLNIVFFFNGFLIFYDKWFWAGSYYSHSPLVVIAFFWLFIRRLKNYTSLPEKTSRYLFGFFIITLSFFVYLIGLWKNISTLITWSMFSFVIGNSVLFFGKNFVIKNIGIFIYLLLAIPVPEVFIDRFTFGLNLFASYSSGLLLSLIYPSTIRSGNILQVNGYDILITPECSGLSNLLSMFSVVWLMALVQRKRIISTIDYLVSIPAAIISNIIRIIVVTVLVVNGYEQLALEDWHYEIGIGVFIVIIILIALYNEFPFKIKNIHFKISFDRLILFFDKNKKIINYYIVILLILSSAGFIISRISTKNSDSEILLKDKIPDSIGNWKSRDESIDDYYYTQLSTNNLLMRAYREKENKNEGDDVYLFIIRSKDNVSAFHRPEVCLRGEGYELITDSQMDLPLKNNKVIPVRRMVFVDKGEGLLVYYWYYINGENTKNTLKYQLSFLFSMNKDSGGNFIRISKPVNLEKIPQDEQKMKQFAYEVIPDILKYL